MNFDGWRAKQEAETIMIKSPGDGADMRGGGENELDNV